LHAKIQVSEYRHENPVYYEERLEIKPVAWFGLDTEAPDFVFTREVSFFSTQLY